MVEKDFQTMFKHWVANNPPDKASVYELKLVKTGRLEFDRVYDHQVGALRQAKYKGVYHKIADQQATIVNGRRMHLGSKNPFDCFFLKGVEAYVAVLFYKPNHLKEMFLIDIDRWVKEKESSKRRSLTKERAGEIAWRSAVLP
jgi:hypothetical protein